MNIDTRRPPSFLTEWLLLGAALLVLGGFVAYSLFVEHSAIGQREEERLAAQAKVIHDNLGRQILTISRALVSLREEMPVWQKEKGGMALANRRLSAFTDALPGVRTMLILDAAGTARASSRPELVGLNFSHRDYFKTARDNPDPDTLNVCPPFKSVLGIYTFNVTRKITGPRGEFAGIVTASIDPEEFKILLGSVLYSPDMWSAIVHGSGALFMMLPDQAEAAGKYLTESDSLFSKHMASGKSGTVLTGTSRARSEQRLVAHQTVDPAGLFMDNELIVAVSRDRNVLYAPWRREAQARGGLFGLLLLSSVFGLYLLQQRRREAMQEAAAAETALNEKSVELERFFNVTLDLLCIADIDGGFKKLNSAWEAKLGYTRARLETARLIDFVHPDDRDTTRTALADLAAGKPVVNFTTRYRHAEGDYRTIEWHATPQDKLFYAAARDVSDRKAMEGALIEAKLAAEAASQAKGQFLANMSHEIRTPMNAVLGLLQLLQHTELSDRQRDYAQKAHAAAQSLLGILNDILDFSKVEAGKMVLEDAPFRLDQLLRNLSVVLSTAVARKDVEVLFDVGADIPRVLKGDSLRLQQVLLNLAGNAIKFTEHGEVVLSVRSLDSPAERGRIEFAVQDSGIGIAADKLESIFAGFIQAEASTGRRYGGTGLGLAISQRMVRLMGGELTVDSAPGHGSRFSFILEFSRIDLVGTSEATLHRATTAQPHALRVLIVDDNATARAVLTETMARLGWQADTAVDGAAALALLESNNADSQPRYDAIFVDWQMPGMDGWETAQRIRAMRQAGQAPVIIMITAHGREVLAERLESDDNPLNGFLVKPVTASMLFDALADASAGHATALDRRSSHRPQAVPLAGLRLLIVEDNLTNQQVARELLTLQGARVDVAGNGRQGIDRVAAAEQPYDAVLMDLQMPDMDGFEATRILRGRMGLRQLPIIAMTANALPEDREKCLAAGMNDHVGKPINMKSLVAVLLRHCGRPATAKPVAPSPAHPILPLPELPPGFALANALERLGNNRETFVRMLGIFKLDQHALRERLLEALAQHDLASAARELHTLKGLAGTLGASALADFSRNAEAAVKDGSDHAAIDALPARLAAALDETLAVLEGVATLFAPTRKTGPAEPLADDAALLAELENLEELLAKRNLRALDVHGALQNDFGPMLGAKLTPLNTAIAQMDFSAALAASQLLRNTLTP